MDSTPLPAPRPDKRIVFVHTDGLCQIMGVERPDQLPVVLNFGPAMPFASLVKVTPRAAFYKAPMVPQSYGSFHPEQR